MPAGLTLPKTARKLKPRGLEVIVTTFARQREESPAEPSRLTFISVTYIAPIFYPESSVNFIPGLALFSLSFLSFSVSLFLVGAFIVSSITRSGRGVLNHPVGDICGQRDGRLHKS